MKNTKKFLDGKTAEPVKLRVRSYKKMTNSRDMVNQTELLQPDITIEYLPYGSDMPYRIIVQNNPVNFVDPWGLATYMCTKPLDVVGGSGRKSGPDVWGNPLYHQYICVKNGKVTTCGGQSSGGEAYGPGKPSNDTFDSGRCEEEPDNDCFEKCLIKKFGESRPYYGVAGPGTNCQEWADDTVSQCRRQCK